MSFSNKIEYTFRNIEIQAIVKNSEIAHYCIEKGENFMFFNVMKAKDIVDLEDGKFKRETLLEKGESCLSVIAIKKDEIIDTHTSAADAAVYVVNGKIELHFDAEKFTLSEGELLMFKKDKEHKVVALKDSEFLLIKI